MTARQERRQAKKARRDGRHVPGCPFHGKGPQSADRHEYVCLCAVDPVRGLGRPGGKLRSLPMGQEYLW